jgi:hypothetical protein
MSQLINEILLRVAKLVVAGIFGAIVYLVAVGPLNVAPSFELAALCWSSSCLGLILVSSSPL